MTEIDQSILRARNVETMFAAAVSVSPLIAIQQCGWLKPDMLLTLGIRRYWEMVLERINTGMEYDEAGAIAMQAAMEAGIWRDLGQWEQEVRNTHQPNSYALEIARRNYVIQQQQSLPELSKALYEFDHETAREIIATMNARQEGAAVKLPDAWQLATTFEDVVNSGKRSVDTFIPQLDAATGGLERQTLTILAARPSMGKTALAWQIARNVTNSGGKVLFFSLEMSATNLWGRAACPVVKTTWRDVRAGRLNAEQKDKLIQASYELGMQYQDRLIILDDSHTTETIWRAVSQYQPDLVVIDHLRLIKDRNDNENKRQGAISERLKEIAKNFGTSVLCCVQLNRGVEARGDKRPILSDLRDSGEIEENADVVLMLYRDDYYNPLPNFNGKPPETSPTELWVRKFRDGAREAKILMTMRLQEGWFV